MQKERERKKYRGRSPSLPAETGCSPALRKGGRARRVKMWPDNFYVSSQSREILQCPLRNPVDLFHSETIVKICAPMVRYSKLPFRTLVRKYDCDLCYTPMIVAADFVRSVKARHSEFTTNQGDRPLIVQFAAKDAHVLAEAACIISPFADGVDVNCGCPQRWAMAEGFGACLINKPELVQEMVRLVRNQVENPMFSVSIKIRIHDDLKRTVDLCQKAEAAGVSWITVHGRNVEERHQPVHYDAIKIIKQSMSIPVIANGDIKSLKDVKDVHQKTGTDGIMVARGLLANPAMFAGYEETPLRCLQDWFPPPPPPPTRVWRAESGPERARGAAGRGRRTPEDASPPSGDEGRREKAAAAAPLWKARSLTDKMTFQWTAVAAFLYAEIAILLLLCLPIISPLRWEKVFMISVWSRIKNYWNKGFLTIIVLLIVLFLDAVREVRKYSNVNLSDKTAHTSANALDHIQMKLFRSQRNLYISGFSLFLWLVLRRTISLITSLAKKMGDQKALEMEVENINKVAKKCLEENEKLQSMKAKCDMGEVSDEELQEEVKKLKDELKKTSHALSKAKDDFSTTQKRCEGLRKEYDQLTKEYNRMQCSSGGKHDKKGQ
ncbi:tRNA-dihydrouridine20a/20b 20b synthase NADP+-like isoform X2 [Podarcis lilfordi]|uniref:tRNA-dihydrouridine(20a/20b) synthase [NAD(P)+]-like n=1 Tax=Podarcis lilfordi TaxID=74358 RepID=A0AA35PHT1_9SAUR|nr:tRNA-dihydrouridine20a/20b 20b synthase NADP+-like isoform X2 [Podarcis lilfordi]